ncbi:MAG TPA: PadR family transcriptional regulator [Phototrophicaceae bacterium]|nr:PadR family transcriptional regulator [Phototrophicaceae bacterium]
MSLAHAILGMLTYQPMTGYDLKTLCFDGSISHFWEADQAQIYRTLDKLTEQGMVESEIEYQDTRPNRKIYHLTLAGRAMLDEWLQTTQPLPTRREAFLIQVFFGYRLTDDETTALIHQQIQMHRDLLEHYHQIPLPQFDDPAMTREQMYNRFTLDLGIRNEEMYIAWLETCLTRIKSLQTTTPTSP